MMIIRSTINIAQYSFKSLDIWVCLLNGIEEDLTKSIPPQLPPTKSEDRL